jgi:flagella basal body P-ring formation protein FlgA
MTPRNHLPAVPAPASYWLLVFMVLLIGAPSSDASVGPQALRLSVKSFIEAQLKNQPGTGRWEVEVAHLDSRLRLADCNHLPRHQVGGDGDVNKPRITVRVSCAAPTPWSLFVPVSLRHYQPVLTTTRPLSRGDMLGSEDVQLREVDVMGLNNNYYVDSGAILGMLVNRSLPANTPLGSRHLEKPILVKKGDEVLIQANAGPVSVRAIGVALANGTEGQQIDVQNSQSKQIVKARVVSRGNVAVAM